MEDGKSEGHKVNKYPFACAIVASVICIIFGYDTGVMSGAMVLIQEDLKVSDAQIQVLAGILNLCALVGSLCAGRTSDFIGRRYTIVAASIIFFLGSVLMGYSPNYAVLMLGRCTAGIGVGFALMIAPVYSAEISSASSRGFLTSLPELAIAIGILLGYISNYFLARLTLKLGWRLMLGIAAIPSIVLAFGILKMPESPRWLAMQGRLGDTMRVLLKVSNSKEEAEARFHDIISSVGIDENRSTTVDTPASHMTSGAHAGSTVRPHTLSSKEREDTPEVLNKNPIAKPPSKGGEGVWKELLLHPSPPVRWMLLAVVGIHFFEHATGIEAVVLYSPRIFNKAGVTDKHKLFLATIGIGVIKTVCIFISSLFLDKVGRRRLLLTSVGGMIVALTGLGLGLTMVDHSQQKLHWALAFCITTTYIFVAFFNIGLAPVTWVYSSEVFPSKLRAQGHSIGVAVNRLMNAVISMSFISIYKAITIGGAFFMFAGISIVAWLFFYFFLPETKGRTLEEMESIFSKRSGNRNGETELQPGPEKIALHNQKEYELNITKSENSKIDS